jgi:hypothetical protein
MSCIADTFCFLLAALPLCRQAPKPGVSDLQSTKVLGKFKHHLQSRLLSLCKDSGEIHNQAEYGLKNLKKDS